MTTWKGNVIVVGAGVMGSATAHALVAGAARSTTSTAPPRVALLECALPTK